MVNYLDKWKGILILGGIGDACGHTTPQDMKLGKWVFSDDTVLTMGVAKALLECNNSCSMTWDPIPVMRVQQKVVLEDEKTRHSNCPFSGPNYRGFGEKTWRLFQHWTPDSSHEKGHWDTCGLLMKISPLAALAESPSLSDVSVAGYFTHGGHSTATFVAWLHVKVLRYLLFSNVPLTWERVLKWSQECGDPFLQVSLRAASLSPPPLKVHLSAFQHLFGRCGRNKAVVVFTLALWSAMPYLNNSVPEFEKLVSAIVESDSLQDSDTVAKVAAEMMGARFGLTACFGSWKMTLENTVALESLAVQLSKLDKTRHLSV